jgi:uncharacterized protein YqgC (DUF456 family)
MDPTLFYLAAVALVIVGLLGTVLPVLPGALFVFAGLLLAACWAWSPGARTSPRP